MIQVNNSPHLHKFDTYSYMTSIDNQCELKRTNTTPSHDMSQPDALQQAVRLWIQYLQSVINCNTLWLTGWEGWGLIVEYSYPCDIILPYIIHLILQQLHMRKKSPIGRSFAISKKINKSESHCVLYAIYIDWSWFQVLRKSMAFITWNCWQCVSLDMDFMGGLNTINMCDTSSLGNGCVPQNRHHNRIIILLVQMRWSHVMWLDIWNVENTSWGSDWQAKWIQIKWIMIQVNNSHHIIIFIYDFNR